MYTKIQKPPTLLIVSKVGGFTPIRARLANQFWAKLSAETR